MIGDSYPRSLAEDVPVWSDRLALERAVVDAWDEVALVRSLEPLEVPAEGLRGLLVMVGRAATRAYATILHGERAGARALVGYRADPELRAAYRRLEELYRTRAGQRVRLGERLVLSGAVS